MTRAIARVVLCGALVCLTAAVTLAQTSTTTETKKFEVISVEGNQLVVRLPEGTRELTVPEDFRFTVDGRSLSVHELRAGMAGTATISTKTTVTPVTVTEVKNGTVVYAMGQSIIVRTAEGEVKQFTQSDIDRRGVKIMREGKPAGISDFRANDRLSATIITSRPPRVMTEKEVQATLAKSGAPASTAAASPSPSTAPTTAAAAPPLSAAATSTAPRTLPKTGSLLPVVGLAGLASLFAGFGLTLRRRRATRE
jgi:LPXTG-motif cell wall-anchored protein